MTKVLSLEGARCLLCTLLFFATHVCGQKESGLGLSEIESGRLSLKKQRPVYQNYSFKQYTNYPNHSTPYADHPVAFFGSLGSYLLTGYELWHWEEHRTAGLEYGSAIYQDRQPWVVTFDNMAMAKDGYGDWGYSLFVGNGLRARLTPLTLSMVSFNGCRLDLITPGLRATAMASRIERPKSYVETVPTWAIDDEHFAEASTLLLGSRLETQVGNLHLGVNGANIHVYDSTQPGNGLKGRVRPSLALINWVVVRFADDSPEDGIGGPVVQEAVLRIDGERRHDLRPIVIRHRKGISTQLGKTSRATGEFSRTNYNSFKGYYQNNFKYYRGRNEVPLYADYLVRAEHEAGIDVSDQSNVEGLVRDFIYENPAIPLKADGDEVLVYMWELTDQQHVESVDVEALVANDYHVEVAILDRPNVRAKNKAQAFKTTFYKTMARARGNVQDLSNLKRIRIPIGEHTALFTYSADMNFNLAGLEVNGEFARSSLYSRFPAQDNSTKIYDEGKRSAEHGTAYFLNATRWWGNMRFGAEYFKMNPDFNTTMRTFVPFEAGLTETNLAGMANSTVYWDLVEDNDDGDRYPDFRIGNLQGLPNDRRDYDIDGVFTGQDADGDGFPDTNRNGNGTPDYEEPFLMYDVEPIEYVYGLDRNNNDEPDFREDDYDFDYPYDKDQGGFHVFGHFDLTRNSSVTLGRYSVEQIGGNGQSRSTYVLFGFRRQGIFRLKELFFENNFRRVEDTVADTYTYQDETPGRGSMFGYRGLERAAAGTIGIPIFNIGVASDPLSYQDSYVNETVLETKVNPLSKLFIEQKVRLRLNWQQERETVFGFKQRERRLDYWTWVSKIENTWTLGRLQIKPQYKYLLLHYEDQDADRKPGGNYSSRVLRYETRSIPIVRVELPLMHRTKLQAGVQGFGALTYRVKDRIRESRSYQERNTFLSVINRSRYFGYDLFTIVGMSKNNRKYDEPARVAEEFDSMSFFVRTLIGFTEHGRPI